MLCHAAEHLIYAVMPPRFIPTPDSVVYNNIIFNKNTQENAVFTQISISFAAVSIVSLLYKEKLKYQQVLFNLIIEEKANEFIYIQ